MRGAGGPERRRRRTRGFARVRATKRPFSLALAGDVAQRRRWYARRVVHARRGDGAPPCGALRVPSGARGVACYNARRVAEEVLIVAGEASADLHARARSRGAPRAAPRASARSASAGHACARRASRRSRRAEEISVMGFAEVLPAPPADPRDPASRSRAAAASAARRRRSSSTSPTSTCGSRRSSRSSGSRSSTTSRRRSGRGAAGARRRFAKVVDRMLCILPFEPSRSTREPGSSARFVGHPFAEQPAPRAPERYRAALGLDGRPHHRRARPGEPPERAAAHPPARCSTPRSGSARAHPDAQFVVPVAPTARARGRLVPYLARTRDHRGEARRRPRRGGRSARATPRIVKSGTVDARGRAHAAADGGRVPAVVALATRSRGCSSRSRTSRS